MEAGELQEFDEPYILLQNPKGIFTDMVKKTGPGTSQDLRNIAKEVMDMVDNIQKQYVILFFLLQTYNARHSM